MEPKKLDFNNDNDESWGNNDTMEDDTLYPKGYSVGGPSTELPLPPLVEPPPAASKTTKAKGKGSSKPSPGKPSPAKKTQGNIKRVVRGGKIGAAGDVKGLYWSEQDNELFEEGVIQHGWGNWMAVSKHITSRDNNQVKSHAQVRLHSYPILYIRKLLPYSSHTSKCTFLQNRDMVGVMRKGRRCSLSNIKQRPRPKRLLTTTTQQQQGPHA